MKKLLIATACSAVLATSAAHAALVQGTPGQQSTGSFDVSMQILETVNVSNLDNLAMGIYVNGTDMSTTGQFCTYYNNAATVGLTFTSLNGTGGLFAATDGTTPLPYTLALDIDGGALDDNFAQTVNSGTPIASIPAYSTAQDNCATGTADTVGIQAVMLSTDIAGNSNGTYTDTVTVVADPQP